MCYQSPAAPAPPDIARKPVSPRPRGHGHARLSPRPWLARHSQLRQVLGAWQVAEVIQGPRPGSAQPRRAVGQQTSGQDAAPADASINQASRLPGPVARRVPARLPVPPRSIATAPASPRPGSRPVRLQLPLPGLPRHVRWAVLKTSRQERRGGARGPARPRPAPSVSNPALSSSKSRTLPQPFSRPPCSSLLPQGPPAPVDAEGQPQKASGMSAGNGALGS